MPIRLTSTTALITVAILMSANTASARATLQQCIASEAKASGFSGVISITRPGGIVTHAQGFMAAPGSAKMNANAQFNIGSAGKMWTAVAVAQLIDAKMVTLDDPIGRHVSGLTPEASAVTVRQLLTNSGGLGNFFTPNNLDVFKRATTLAELKPLITAEKPAFLPGTRSQYSNSGFLLLGLMIEQVSGQSYGDYLKARIFKPAGMTGSGMTPAGSKARALGMTNLPAFDDKPGGPPPGPPPGPQLGPLPGGPDGPMPSPPGPLRVSDEAALMGTSAGGGFSTASDMQRFFAALLAGKLTGATMRDALTSRQIEVLPAKGPLPAIFYGFGFMIADHKGHGWIGHNGGLPGANVATSSFVKDQITAVVLTNRDPPAADMMMRKVQAKLFDGDCGG